MANTITVNKKGFVRLVDHMPQQDLDDSIVQAARVSYADGTTTTRNTTGLIRYLMRHWHTSPFEMVEFKFHIKMPIFIARQHLRHRTASVNEMSARYSVLPREYFYDDQAFRPQSSTNKQSSDDDQIVTVDTPGVAELCESAFDLYDKLLEDGVCREIARAHLPLSTYTEFYWKIDLHNLMHYLQLRLEPGAQKEIRDYAKAIYDLVAPLLPITMKAFSDFRLNSIQLSAVEIECIVNKKEPDGPGEKKEFNDKLKKLGLFPITNI